MTESVELHGWAMARDMVLDILLDLCDFVGFKDFQRLFADVRISWNEENHGFYSSLSLTGVNGLSQ